MTLDHDGCDGEFVDVKVPLGGFLIPAKACETCGERHLDPACTQLVAAYEKLREDRFDATVTTTGNSTALRVDKTIARELGLDRGDKLDIDLASPTEIVIHLPETIEPAETGTIPGTPEALDREIDRLAAAMHEPRGRILRRALVEGVAALRLERALSAYARDEATLEEAAGMAGVSLQVLAKEAAGRGIPRYWDTASPGEGRAGVLASGSEDNDEDHS